MKLSTVLIGVFCCSNIYAVNVQAEALSAQLKVSKSKKLLIHVDERGPGVYADEKGNAIVFSNIYQTHKVIVNPATKKTSIKKNSLKLAYLIYSAKKKQWLKQQYVPMADTAGHKVKNYYFLNSQSNTTPMLVYTTALNTGTQGYTGSYAKGDQLWSIRKKGLTGAWTKPQKILTIKENTSPFTTVEKKCNNDACVVAWKELKKTTNSKGGHHSDINLKFLNLNGKNNVEWSNRVVAGIPVTHQLIQFKVGLLDSGNAVLVWLAASQAANSRTKATLALYTRFRINGKWQAISTVAVMGEQGDITGLGEFELASNKSRQLLIVWNEKLKYPQIGSIFFDKNWRKKSIIYNDIPDALNLSPVLTANGTAALVWQQKYGKNSHVFNSKYNSKTNKWTVPTKIDLNSTGSVLKSISINNKNEVAAVWIKGFQKLQMALFDSNHKKVAHLNNITQNRQSPHLPMAALSGAGDIYTVWLSFTKTGYEVWGNIATKSKNKGAKQ